MHKGFLKTAAVLGALSVVFGAFAAHALKEAIKNDVLSIFETGVRYQFYHVFALLATGILYKDSPGKLLRWAGMFFIAGIILFSGSLYFLTYVTSYDLQNLRWVGIITPFGGLSFIAGWVCLCAAFFKKK
ncbi:MAG: DUF423 domain-containing protein [Ginsengibacter sp.]